MRATTSSKGSNVSPERKDCAISGVNARARENPTPTAAAPISYQRNLNASRRSDVVNRLVRRVETRMATAIVTSSNDDRKTMGACGPDTEDHASSRKCSVYAAHAICQARKYGCLLCSCRYVNSKKSRQATKPGKIAVLMRILFIVGLTRTPSSVARGNRQLLCFHMLSFKTTFLAPS